MSDDPGFTLRALWTLRDDRTLDAATMRVAVALVMYSNADGECRPSVRRLAATARTSPGAVRRALVKLQTGGGPIRATVRATKSEHGDPDCHHYKMTVKGWDQAYPTRDQAHPTVGSGVPHGVGSGSTGGGITGAPEEDREEDKKKRTEKRGSRSRGSRTPPSDFVPSDVDVQQEQEARKRGVDVELQRKLWHKYTYKRPVVDFHAAWQNWLLKAIEFLPRGRGGTVRVQETPEGATFDDAAEQRAEEAARRGAARSNVVPLPLPMAGGAK